MIDKRKLGYLRLKGEKVPIEESELLKAGIPEIVITNARSLGLAPVSIINMLLRFGDTFAPILHQIVFDLKPVSQKLFQESVWSFKTAPTNLGDTVLKIVEVNFSNPPAPGHQVYTLDPRVAISVKSVLTEHLDNLAIKYTQIILTSGVLDTQTVWYLKGKVHDG